MNQRYILLILTFVAYMLVVTNLNAQHDCDLSIVSVEFGQAILPNTLAGECKPENTLDVEVFYTEDSSDTLRINGKSIAITGSPQIIEIIGIPQVLFVELVGTECYRFEDINLLGLPPAPQIMEGDTVFCAGETIPPIILSGHANSTFHWTNKDGSCVQSLFFSGAYNEEWTFPHLGEFTVYQHIDGMVTRPLHINVREGLPVEIVGESYFCEGDFSTLNVLVNGENITPEYEIMWQTPLGIEPDVVSINADFEYLYIVEVTDDKGCVGTSSVWVTETPTPDLMIVEPDPFCEGNPIDLRAVAHGAGCGSACEYSWQLPDGTVLNQQIIQATNEGTYTISVNGIDGCTTTESIVIEEDCDEVVSVENPEEASIFELYPNPNHGAFNMEFPNNHERQLTLYNLQGQAIYQVKHTGQLAGINVQHLSLPAGMYIMQVHEEGFTVTKRVVIM